MSLTFEAFRRQVLKELTKTQTYQHFYGTVRAFDRVGGLEQFAHDLLPMLQACYTQNLNIQETAVRVNNLSELTKMKANLYVAELKHKESR